MSVANEHPAGFNGASGALALAAALCIPLPASLLAWLSRISLHLHFKKNTSPAADMFLIDFRTFLKYT
jgi:hypothetical protein